MSPYTLELAAFVIPAILTVVILIGAINDSLR
jgi:hypothetical protein